MGGTITSTELASNAVATTNIAASAVTGAKLNSNVVGVNMVYNSSTSKLDVIRRVLDPVRCASVATVNPTTGTEVGDVIDGYTLVAGDRILLRLQGGGAHVDNGIYVVQSSGGATRATDVAGSRSDQLTVDCTVFVSGGTVNAGTTWRVSATSGSASGIAVGTDTTTWTRVEAPVLAASVYPGTLRAGNYVLVGDMSATTFTATSDQRKKRNIKELNADKALESICKARGVTFEWEDSKAKCAGVIAQEIQEFAPELVKTDEQSFLSLNYDGLNGYLFASIKALNERLEKLEKSPQKRKLANTMCECACACNQDGSSSPAKRPNV